MSQPLPYCVLVVDDDVISANLLCYLLESYGFATLQASSGAEALERVDTYAVDLILLDINMPGMSGLDVLERIRERHPQHTLPVIMLSARSDSTTIIRAFKLGANDYITKPVEDFDVVLIRVESHIRMRDAIQTELQVYQPPEPDCYCSRCLSGLFASDKACVECGWARRGKDWPTIAESEHPHLGRTLDNRYTLKKPLGIGSAGVVYSAYDQKLGRTYAVKIIQGARSSSPSRHRALQLEIRAMARLRNSHVVKLHEVLELDEGTVALIMDLVHGIDLDTLIAENGTLDVELALDLTRQLVQALHEAHTYGLIHRDIKPDNIMLEALPVGGHMVKLLDFGIAHVRGYVQGDAGFYGTPQYASPEQIQRLDDLDHRSDIYSMGAVLYHMLHGDIPYPSNDIAQALSAHLYHPIPPLGRHVAEPLLRAQLDGLIQRMMAKHPDDRFQDLQEVYLQLEFILAALRRSEDESIDIDAGNITQLGKPVEPAVYKPIDIERYTQSQAISERLKRKLAEAHTSDHTPPPV